MNVHANNACCMYYIMEDDAPFYCCSITYMLKYITDTYTQLYY